MLRWLDPEDFRVLLAVEMASRNHQVAPLGLIERIAGLKAGGARKRLMWLLKHKFLLHECQVYDGFRMNYQAYDYLALRTFSKRESVAGVGAKIGVGKESDIYMCQNEDGTSLVLKLQRLGRTSFRTIKKNRDYKGKFKTLHGESWYYLSRLAATKEYAFMKALHQEGFPVPTPVDQNRHAIVMSMIDGYQLNSVKEVAHPQRVFKNCIDLIVKFAEYGLIHGDFNEFNIMITDEEELFVLDFPQMVSTEHPHAEEFFNRDVECIHAFFRRKWKMDFDYRPQLHVDTERQHTLDQRVQASGYSTAEARAAIGLLDPDKDSDSDSDEEEEEEESEEESEEEEAPAAAAPEPELPPGFIRLDVEALRELGIGEEAGEEEGFDEREGAPVLDEEVEGKKKRGGYSGDKAETRSMATKRVPRSQAGLRGTGKGNYQVTESGQTEINRDHVKGKVKGILGREELREFTKKCKQNTMKVKDKRGRKRDIVGLKEGLRKDGLA